MKQQVGVVVIGRNEGDRLRRCLHSLSDHTDITVYVDSGSSDGSPEFAESIGVDVLHLSTILPFSASRARNEGFCHLLKKFPALEYIHFIDGDCESHQDWIGHACEFLGNNQKCAIVAGRLKELYPHKSVYNLLCDIEWNVPTGKTRSCGGIFTVRARAFFEVKGFNQEVVAGEEPDLCFRLIKRGWDIFRIDKPMAHHDAAMSNFSQWWMRTVRSGHSYAQGCTLHGWRPQAYGCIESLKIWIWAILFPVVVLLLSVAITPLFSLFFVAYLFQFAKITFSTNRQLCNIKHSIIYSFFIVLAKWPQMVGQLIFILRKLSRKDYLVIEHR